MTVAHRLAEEVRLVRAGTRVAPAHVRLQLSQGWRAVYSPAAITQVSAAGAERKMGAWPEDMDRLLPPRISVSNSRNKVGERLGQMGTVFMTRFITPSTIEGRIAEVLERKRQLFNELIGQNGKPPSLGLSQEVILGLFDVQARPKRMAA